jgi:hypothetical protein
MKVSARSLRAMLYSGLVPNGAMPTRVTAFRTGNVRHGRCARVEASRAADVVEILFFQHEDGSWRVFPPEPLRPVMELF